MNNIKIMVVEDERIAAEDIRIALEILGYTVTNVASSGREALIKAEEQTPDLMLVDIKLKGRMDGIEVAGQINIKYHIPVVFITAYADKATLERVKYTEPYGYILKPFEEEELQGVIETVLYRHKIEMKLKENEAWLNTTLRSIGDAVIATDRDSKITFMNPEAEKLTGWSETEAKSKSLDQVFKIIDEDTGQPITNILNTVLCERKAFDLAERLILITKKEVQIPIDDSCSPIKDDAGNIIGVVLVFKDITERRNIEEKLRYRIEFERLVSTISRNFINLSVDQIDNEIIKTLKIVGEFVDADRSCLFLFDDTQKIFDSASEWCAAGIKSRCQELQGQSLDIFPWLKKQVIRGKIIHIPHVKELPPEAKTEKEAFQSDKIQSMLIIPLKYDKKIIGFLKFDSVRSLKTWSADQIILQRIVGEILTNALECKNNEKRLKESEEKYKLLISSATEAISVFDQEGRFLILNEAAAKLLGGQTNDFIDKKLIDVLPKKFASDRICSIQEVMQSGQGHIMEICVPLQNKRRWFRQNTQPVIDKSGQITSILSVSTEITDRKLAEAALKESEQRFRNVIQSSLMGIHMYDLERGNRLVFRGANRAADNILGINNKQFIGKTIEEAFPILADTDIPSNYRRVAAKGESWQNDHIEYKNREISGIFQVFAFQTKPGSMAAMFMDITERKIFENAVRESEERYRLMFETMAQGAERILGMPLDKLRGKSPKDLKLKAFREDRSIFPYNQFPAKVSLKSGKEVKNVVMAILNPLSNELHWININTKPQFNYGEDKPYQVYSTFEDISNRKHSEVAIERLAMFPSENPNPVLRISKEGIILYGNKSSSLLLKTWGVKAGESLPGEWYQYIVKVLETKKTQQFEIECDNTIYSLTFAPIPAHDYVNIYALNITEHKHAEESIKSLLKEKELLLKEVYHRVKNNFTVVSSLLSLQSRLVKDKKAREMFKDSQERVRTMALIHQSLYQSNDLTKIDFSRYISNLVNGLYQTYCARTNKISLMTEIEDVTLGIDLAIPCGLIVNELVSNSLKYGFPSRFKGKGKIKVGIHKSKRNDFELIISDNGVGLPDDLDIRNTKSLGLRLVTMLVEDQLHGKIMLDRKSGTNYRINLKRK
jgi:PAS domain S-box-containing protein